MSQLQAGTGTVRIVARNKINRLRLSTLDTVSGMGHAVDTGMNGKEKCFACGKRVGLHPHVGYTRDGQQVYIGRECWKHVEQSGDMGYQPPLGGPRIFKSSNSHHGRNEKGERMKDASTQAIREALLDALAYAELKIAGFRQDYPEEHAMVQTPIRLKEKLEHALQEIV